MFVNSTSVCKQFKRSNITITVIFSKANKEYWEAVEEQGGNIYNGRFKTTFPVNLRIFSPEDMKDSIRILRNVESTCFVQGNFWVTSILGTPAETFSDVFSVIQQHGIALSSKSFIKARSDRQYAPRCSYAISSWILFHSSHPTFSDVWSTNKLPFNKLTGLLSFKIIELLRIK